MDAKPVNWKYAAVKIENWWQVLAIHPDNGWMKAIAFFVSERLADSYADMANDMEMEGVEYSAARNEAAEALVNMPTVDRANIIPFRFMNHFTDWNEDQDRTLTEMWGTGAPKDDIAKTLGRSRQAVERHARYLGLPSRSKILEKFERGLEKRGAPAVNAVGKIVLAEKAAEA